MISIATVPEYVLNKTGVKRTRQAVYLWVSRGVKGVKLQVELHAGQMFTKPEWIDAFLTVMDRK